MSCFTARPFRNQAEMYQELTSRRNTSISVMDFVLAGVAFDDSIPFQENIQVRKSVVKHNHVRYHTVHPFKGHLRDLVFSVSDLPFYASKDYYYYYYYYYYCVL
jgi:hypothetical protein